MRIPNHKVENMTTGDLKEMHNNLLKELDSYPEESMESDYLYYLIDDIYAELKKRDKGR